MSNVCTICQDNLTEGLAKPCALMCGHIFHYDCIFQWFEGGGKVAPNVGKCPTCNQHNSQYRVLRVFSTAGDDDEDIHWSRSKSVAEMKKELNDLKSKLENATKKLRNLEGIYKTEKDSHGKLKVEHKRVLNIVELAGGELKKVEGKGRTDNNNDGSPPTAFLKIANLLNSTSRDANKLNNLDQKGDAALAYAIGKRMPTEKISNLIWRGADWRHLNRVGQNLLHIAASRGTPEGLKFFLELGEGEPRVNQVDKDGATPLHLALMFEKDGKLLIEKCKSLIQNGADEGITILDKEGRTPLTLACVWRPDKQVQTELVRVMLKLNEPISPSGEEEDNTRREGGATTPIRSSSSSQLNLNPSNPNRGWNRNGRGRGRGRGGNRVRGRGQRQQNSNSNDLVQDFGTLSLMTFD